MQILALVRRFVADWFGVYWGSWYSRAVTILVALVLFLLPFSSDELVVGVRTVAIDPATHVEKSPVDRPVPLRLTVGWWAFIVLAAGFLAIGLGAALEKFWQPLIRISDQLERDTYAFVAEIRNSGFGVAECELVLSSVKDETGLDIIGKASLPIDIRKVKVSNDEPATVVLFHEDIMPPSAYRDRKKDRWQILVNSDPHGHHSVWVMDTDSRDRQVWLRVTARDESRKSTDRRWYGFKARYQEVDGVDGLCPVGFEAICGRPPFLKEERRIDLKKVAVFFPALILSVWNEWQNAAKHIRPSR